MSLAAALAFLAATPIAAPVASSGAMVQPVGARVSALASVEIVRAGRASEGNDGQSVYRTSRRSGPVTTIDFE